MTTKMLTQLEEMIRDGWCDLGIVRELGITPRTVQYWRYRLGLPPGKHHRKDQKRFMVYNRRTDEFLVEGSTKEIASFLGLKKASIYSTISRSRTGEYKKYEFIEVEE